MTGPGAPVRIGNMSGFYGDRLSAMREMLTGGELDYLTGDYLAELTMLILGRDRLADAERGYARTFLRQLEDCLGTALDKRVTIVTDAGGLNPAGLAERIRGLAATLGLSVRVAHVEGDDVMDRIADLDIPSDAGTPVTANAYLGAFGIAHCLDAGADVVVTGRVTDASVIVGPAIAHFGWTRDDLDAIAGATMAGHVIECGTQATGGNYAFTDRSTLAAMRRPGFPIAEISRDGSSVITKHPGTGGLVTVGTVTSQLLYEVTGARYAGPDAVARLDTARLHQVGPDRVALTGVVGEPAPPTTKVSVTCLAGHRNEVTFLLTGLDVETKAELVEIQMREFLERQPARMEFRLQRTDHVDADTQAAATALLTVVGWDPDPEVVGRAFSDAAVALTLASYAGATPSAPPGRGAPYGVYVPAFLPQDTVPHIAVTADGRRQVISAPEVTAPIGDGHAGDGLAADGTVRRPRVFDGPRHRIPLGRVAGARSGDKGGSANIGLWVESDPAYDWMCQTLTVDTLRELLPECADLPVDRYEFPRIRAINFVVQDLLGKGVAHGFRFDPQGKGLGEWLRSRYLPVPAELVPERYLPTTDGPATDRPTTDEHGTESSA